jgi:hypothetical protein
MLGWWVAKVRQTWRHATGRVTRQERRALAGWVSSAQLALFEAMPRPDQRHGLDVVEALRAAGHRDPDLLLAGLLHDCGKGRTVRLWHRIAWSLAERYGAGVRGVAERLPGFPVALSLLERHAERSAELALAAGCSERAADLIRHQSAPRDPGLGEALRLADERS